MFRFGREMSASRLWDVACVARNALRARGVYVGFADSDRSINTYITDCLVPGARISLVLDVGARGGEYAIELRRHGYVGPIVSFEPAPDSYALLAAVAAKDPAWYTFPYALGSLDTEMEMNLTRLSSLNSFLSPGPEGRTLFGPEIEVVESVRVPVRRLDTVLPDVLASTGLAGDRIFLKSDTQGYEFEVVRGASGVLSCIPAIQIEVSFKPLYESEPGFTEALSLMADLGYDLSAFFQIYRDDRLAIVEGDAIFVRGSSS